MSDTTPTNDALVAEPPGGGDTQVMTYLAWMFRSYAVHVVSLIVFFGGWETIVRLSEVEVYMVPPPSAILLALWYNLNSAGYWEDFGITVFETIAGFLLASLGGIALGVTLALSAVAHRICYPYVVALQTIPKVAVAPLMIVWFGFGLESKILIVALTAMFPVLVNTIAGLRSTEPDRLDLLRGLCASRWQRLRHVQIPSALPYIFAGLDTAIVFAVIGAVVGEFVGARKGIGVSILQANFSLDLASVFSSLIVLSVLGVVLNSIVRFFERRVCFWIGRNHK